MDTKQEGWGLPADSRKWHYFRTSTSLCRKWGFFRGELYGDDVDQLDDDCAACRRKRNAELAKRAKADEEARP